MARRASLSSTSRLLTLLTAVASAVAGVPLFLFPSWAAERMPWSVSPFVAMTIGGWCLANAVIAFEVWRVWRWSRVYALLLYLWSFGVLEALVLVMFASKVQLDAALAWPYLAAVSVPAVAAVVGAAELVRGRPEREEGPLHLTVTRVLWAAFCVFVALIALVTWLAPRPALNGRVFPEPLTPFTVRAFAAFYTSLVVGAVPLVFDRWADAGMMYMSRAQALIVFISIAWIVHIDVFDFGRPRHWLYPGAYVVVGIGAALLFLWLRRRARGAATDRS